MHVVGVGPIQSESISVRLNSCPGNTAVLKSAGAQSPEGVHVKLQPIVYLWRRLQELRWDCAAGADSLQEHSVTDLCLVQRVDKALSQFFAAASRLFLVKLLIL